MSGEKESRCGGCKHAVHKSLECLGEVYNPNEGVRRCECPHGERIVNTTGKSVLTDKEADTIARVALAIEKADPGAHLGFISLLKSLKAERLASVRLRKVEECARYLTKMMCETKSLDTSRDVTEALHYLVRALDEKETT